ncbi:MAG: hypothetical protein N2Z23_09425 [Pyrinomonadaceae bacterium]|nr:hypothetical protein [Pyrinomonadaceae bacterium]
MKILIFVLFLVSIALGQSPNKLISQANKAFGGEGRLRKISSWIVEGKIKRLSDGAEGKYSAYATSEGFYGSFFDLEGFEVQVGYNGKSGWVRNSRDGLRTLTGDEATFFEAEAYYRVNRWLNYKKDKLKLFMASSETIDGKRADCVFLANLKFVRIKLCFDSVTGLLLKEEIPQVNGTKVFYYRDYRVVDGIQTAFLIKVKTEEEYEITLEKVKYSQQVEKAKFDFPRLSEEPLPDLKILLDQVRSSAENLEEVLDKYSYKETVIEREYDEKGNVIEKSSEKRLLSFYKGYRIVRVIEKNGKKLSLEEENKENRKVEKQIEEIEELIRKNERVIRTGAGGQPSSGGSSRRILLSDALKGSLLVNPRRERYRGFNVIVFDYEPNPNYKPRTRLEQVFALCKGTVWVDEKLGQVVRLEAFLTKNAGNFFAKLKRGSYFVFEGEFVNNEIWLPKRLDINISLNVLFAGFSFNNLVVYEDYRKFDTQVQEAKTEGW